MDKFKQTHPQWQASLVKNTLLMVALLLDRQTVCLWKLKASVGKFLGNTHTDSRSHYQRIKRWFKQGLEHKYVWLVLLQCAMGLLTKATKVLILDGSSWQWGGKTYHFLTLSVVYRGVAIPIYWIELAKLGISSQSQRKVLLESVLKIADLSGKVLLADREYIGGEWFKALTDKGLDFVIRLREGNYKHAIRAAGIKQEKLEKKALKRVGSLFCKPFGIKGQNYYLLVTAYKERNGKTALLRLITCLANPWKAVDLYRVRYRIEPMFKHLKSNGFDLQSLHLQSSRKIRLMMALLVLAYTLSVIEGLKKYRRKYLPLKHGSPAMSVFRVGIEKWQNHLSSFAVFLEKAFACFNLILEQKKHQLNLNVP
ncbi:MAG TPA: transposase [Phototrophicaceae bacterium]|nr:transposase [Phototrophicaceae bacterium]